MSQCTIVGTLSYGLLFLLLTSTGLADDATRPAWVSEQGRRVIGGDILEWGTGEGVTPEQARFKAEAMAIRAMINECSLAHRDISIWDRFMEKAVDGSYHAYARSSLQIDLCEQGKRARGFERKRISSEKLEQDQRDFDLLEEKLNTETFLGRIRWIS